MKKFWGLVLALNIISPSFAYDDFIISIGDTIAQVKNKSPQIIKVDIVTTIRNERDTIIVTSLSEGKGNFSIILENGQVSDFTVSVSKDKSIIKSNKEYKINQLDEFKNVGEEKETQEFDFELDLPPGVEWNK